MHSFIFISDSPIGEQIENEGLDLPTGVAILPGSNIATPCFFVGDDAFTLSMKMMKPYSGSFLGEESRIYNYRICRARRVIENAFGILVSKFRVFENAISLLPESVDVIILAGICLHNFLRSKEIMKDPSGQFYEDPEFQREDQVTDTVIPQDEKQMRDILKNYFLTPEGSVPWKQDSVNHRAKGWDELDLLH